MRVGATRRMDATVAFLALALLAPAQGVAATLNLQITATTDDAVEQGNGTRGTALAGMRAWIWQTTPATSINYRAGGLRFSGVTIPPGSTINSATLRVTVPNTSTGDDFFATFYGHATDNAVDFTSNPYILSQVAEPNGRPRTTANAPFALSNIGTGVRDFTVTPIVQEILSRAGWQSGNALALLVIPGVGALQQIDFCDVSSSAPCTGGTTGAQLLLDYTPPSIVLGNHGSGQIPNQFTTFPVVTSAPLFRFRLTNTTGAAVTVDRLVVRLGRVYQISRFDISQLRVNDGTTDVSLSGVPYIGGRNGTLTFDFFAESGPVSTGFAEKVAWQLVRATDGLAMASLPGAPAGDPAAGLAARATFERDRIYQPGLLDAPDPWLWEAAGSGVGKSVTLALDGVDPSGGLVRLAVDLQGGSDAEGVADHHVRVKIGGVLAGSATFDGKKPFRFEATLSGSALQEGANELVVENAGDTGVQSLVFLDRVEIVYPRLSGASAGAIEAAWEKTGTAEVAVRGPAVAVDVTVGGAPIWLSGVESGPSSARFAAAASATAFSRRGSTCPPCRR